MNAKLDEIKRLAEKQRDTWLYLSPEYLLAAHTLRLIKALEKCRELHDELVDLWSSDFYEKDILERELAKILEGKEV